MFWGLLSSFPRVLGFFICLFILEKKLTNKRNSMYGRGTMTTSLFSFSWPLVSMASWVSLHCDFLSNFPFACVFFLVLLFYCTLLTTFILFASFFVISEPPSTRNSICFLLSSIFLLLPCPTSPPLLHQIYLPSF